MSVLITQLVARVVADITEYQAGMAKVQATAEETAAATNASGASMSSKAGSRARSLTTLQKVAIGGATVAVYKAAKSYADYDRQMNITQAITGASTKEMEKLRAKSIQLGADVRLPGVSAADVGKSMQELGRAGFNTKQILESVRGTMFLGTAGQLDYADAAEITANAVHTFGLKASQANNVADLLAEGANRSQADVQGMADAFRYSGASASQLHVPMKELVLLIAQLSNNGIQGTVAGTALRAMFSRLQPHTEKQIAAWKELGLLTDKGKSVFFDDQGKFVGAVKASQLYSGALKGLSDQKRNFLTQEAFGAMGLRGFEKALGNTKTLTAMAKSFHEHGSAERLAAANAKGLYGAFAALQNIVQTLGLMLGQGMAPALILVSNGLSALLGPLTRHQTIMTILGTAVMAVGAALLVTKAAMLIYTSATEGTIAATWGFTTALLANPLTWIAIAIIGIILVLRHFGVSLDDVTSAVKYAFNWWVTKAQEVFAWFKRNWQEIVLWIVAPLPMAVRAVIQHWDTIKRVIKNAATDAWAWAVKKFWAIVHFIEYIAPIAYDAAHHLGEQIAQGILDGFGSLAEKLSNSIWSHIPGGKTAQGFLKGAGGFANDAYNNFGIGKGNGSHIVRQHATLHPRANLPTGGGGTTRHPSSYGGAAVHIEHMHVRNEADAYTLANVLGRKVVTR